MRNVLIDEKISREEFQSLIRISKLLTLMFKNDKQRFPSSLSINKFSIYCAVYTNLGTLNFSKRRITSNKVSYIKL